MSELAAKIEQQLRELAELHVHVRFADGRLTLEGLVDSHEARQAAEELASVLAPALAIINHLEVEDRQPEEARHVRIEGTDSGSTPHTTAAAPWLPGEEEPEATTLEQAAGDSGAGESGEPFIAPMDPVLDLDSRGRPRILGGFAQSSLDDVHVETSALDPILGDEALADAVRRELREDAATTALEIEVEVWDSVAHLRGVVVGPEDAEAAEAVAARVPGLAEVADDLEIQTTAHRNPGV
jgi:osmotically-inducible protein OsmY